MSLILFACFFISTQLSGLDSGEYCYVTGQVVNGDSSPVAGATIMLEGTCIGAITDSDGYYYIDKCPIDDSLTFNMRMLAIIPETRTISATAGDTIHIEFTAFPENSFIPSLQLREVSQFWSDTVTICVENWRDLDLSSAVIWQDAWKYNPVWLENDSTLATVLDISADSCYIWVYPGEALQLDFSEACRHIDTSILIADSTLFAAADSGTTHMIDIRNWGNPVLMNFGYLGCEAIGQDALSARTLMVYNEQAILITLLSDTTIVEFPFPTFYYRTDPSLKYLLIWDIYGMIGSSGNAAIISLDNGETTLFDPTPGISESCRHSPDGFRIGGMTPAEQFHVSSLGEVFWLDDYCFRPMNNRCFHSFDQSGNLLHLASMDAHFPDGVFYRDQYFGDEAGTLACIINSDEKCYAAMLDDEGCILSLFEIDSYRYSGLFRHNQYEGSRGVTWLALGEDGVMRLDFNSEESNIIGNRNVLEIAASEDFKTISFIDHSQSTPQVYFHDWDTMEELFSFPLNEDQFSDSSVRLRAINSQGHCLIEEMKRRLTRSYSFTDFQGNTLWHQPELPPKLEHNCFVLQDGTVIFGAGAHLVYYTPVEIHSRM